LSASVLIEFIILIDFIYLISERITNMDSDGTWLSGAGRSVCRVGAGRSVCRAGAGRRRRADRDTAALCRAGVGRPPPGGSRYRGALPRRRGAATVLPVEPLCRNSGEVAAVQEWR
jgi:hypothetical protein